MKKSTPAKVKTAIMDVFEKLPNTELEATGVIKLMRFPYYTVSAHLCQLYASGNLARVAPGTYKLLKPLEKPIKK